MYFQPVKGKSKKRIEEKEERRKVSKRDRLNMEFLSVAEEEKSVPEVGGGALM
jgi:hypothetical protein